MSSSEDKPLLTIQIVGWNSEKTLPETASALASLPQDKVIIRYIDNASTDSSVSTVKAALPQAEIVQLDDNRGFVAHNIGLAKTTTPFVMLHDPDLTVTWSGLEQVMRAFERADVSAVQGLVLRAKSKDGTEVIDSAGIILSGALNGIERGSNEEISNAYEEEKEVLAVTGAAALYRMAALRNVAHSEGEYLDEAFFAYKEDVDLGWRLNRAGLKVLYVPITFARHHRTLGRRGAFNWGLNPAVVYKRLRSPRTRYSLRNWLWMMAKNASLAQLLINGPLVTLRAAVFFALSVLYPPLLMTWLEAIRGIPGMVAKRRIRL